AAAASWKGGSKGRATGSAGEQRGVEMPAPRPVSESAPAAAATDAFTAADGAEGRLQHADSADAMSRRLERETVRLAEKAKELDAERRRLKGAAEVAEREKARAHVERQEALEARRDAAALRLELERERTRLGAEKGGLAAERSLLAAERGRLATEQARIRRGGGGGA
ncbi:unnamed protein product, partial [Laminaria digitata]